MAIINQLPTGEEQEGTLRMTLVRSSSDPQADYSHLAPPELCPRD